MKNIQMYMAWYYVLLLVQVRFRFCQESDFKIVGLDNCVKRKGPNHMNIIELNYKDIYDFSTIDTILMNIFLNHQKASIFGRPDYRHFFNISMSYTSNSEIYMPHGRLKPIGEPSYDPEFGTKNSFLAYKKKTSQSGAQIAWFVTNRVSKSGR